MGDSLFDAKEFKPPAFLDYAMLPTGVYPTGVRWLYQGTDLLVVREADVNKGISGAQNRMFRQAVRNTMHPDAEGTNQVLVVTGVPGVTSRSMWSYDHMTVGETPKLRPCQTGDIQEFIGQWFHDRQGRR